MRLAVSNLAWGTSESAAAIERLAILTVDGIEVAPTRIADWDALTEGKLTAYRESLSAAGLEVSSLQAIFFNKPDAQLIASEDGFSVMLDHSRKVADIGAALGAGVAVFGAPNNRRRGELPLEEARRRAVDRLRRMGDVFGERGVIVGIEPVPTAYDGDFLNTAADVRTMVWEVNHPSVRVHLDTGCVYLAGDSIDREITDSRGFLAHFHLAEPQLGNFSDPQTNHAAAARALNTIGYQGWVAIEMREVMERPLDAVEIAVNFARRTYFAPDQYQ